MSKFSEYRASTPELGTVELKPKVMLNISTLNVESKRILWAYIGESHPEVRDNLKQLSADDFVKNLKDIFQAEQLIDTTGFDCTILNSLITIHGYKAALSV